MRGKKLKLPNLHLVSGTPPIIIAFETGKKRRMERRTGEEELLRDI